ncbi:fibronectin type III domain-containing protein [Micromonospora sp. NPDC048909]|uniref:fibronectin type III domain-containing protein n=1 Tax=Micromonospora sp. NPDC048909 TaxID=3155643 RepID=UPI0033D9E37E
MSSAVANIVRLRLFGIALVAALVAVTQLTAAPAQAGPAINPPPTTSATAVSSTQIRVSWQAARQASAYRISRSTGSGGPYTQLGSSSGLEFLDSGLAPAATYYYVVQAEYRNKLSVQSPQASATTLPVLTAPSGLRLTGTPGTMELTWEKELSEALEETLFARASADAVGEIAIAVDRRR